MHCAGSVANHVLEEEGDVGLDVEVVVEVEGEQLAGRDVQDLLVERWHDGQVPVTLDLQLLKLKSGTNIKIKITGTNLRERERERERVGKLVFYAQSTSAVVR